MARKSIIYNIYSRVPAIAFLVAILMLPDFLPDNYLDIPVRGLLSQPPTNLEAVTTQPASNWHVTDNAFKNHPGLKSVTRWYRLDIPAESVERSSDAAVASHNNSDRIVSVRSSAIGDIAAVDFYLVQNGSLLSSFSTGGNYPETYSEQSDAAYIFKFKSLSTPQSIYVKTQTLGEYEARIRVYNSQDYRVFSTASLAMWSVLNGCMLGLALYSLSLWGVLRDRSFAYLALTQFAIGAVGAYLSHFVKAVWPQWSQKMDVSYSIAAFALGLSFVSIFLFAERFFDYRKNFPHLERYLRWQLYVAAAATATVWLIPPAFMLLVFVVIAIAAVIRHVVVHHKHMEHRFILFYALGISFYLAGGVVFVLSDLGYIQSTQTREIAFHLGAILQGAVWSVSMTQRLKFLEKRHVEIVGAMSHDVSLVRLNSLLNDSFAGHINTTDLDVSMMFVDIAAFSQISTTHSDLDVYGALAQLLEDVVEIIESHGGAVDRSVGAGVLCVFGYKSGGKVHAPAMDAFVAACKIQEMTVQTTVKGQQKIVMPIRIGIHSAKVTIGNIGDRARIDFTMIGSGVNLASRLKEACSPYKIILSQSVYNHLADAGYSVEKLSPISIAVKHRIELLRAFEFNPFGNSGDLLTRAETVFLDYLGLRSMDQRFKVKTGHVVVLENDFCRFQVLDFSRFGFRGIGSQLLGRQTVIQVRLRTSDPRVDALLGDALLAEFALEVRWSRDLPNGYEHGFKIYGGGSRQSAYLFDTLKSYLGAVGDQGKIDDFVVEVAS